MFLSSGTDVSTPLLFQHTAVEMNRPNRATSRSLSIDSGSTQDKLAMPFHQNMRRRLQVVNSNTPSPLVGGKHPRRMTSTEDESPLLVANNEHNQTLSTDQGTLTVNQSSQSMTVKSVAGNETVNSKKANAGNGFQKKFKESAVYLGGKFMRSKAVSQESKYLLNDTENSNKSPEPKTSKTKVKDNSGKSSKMNTSDNSNFAVNAPYQQNDISFRSTGSGFWSSFKPWKAKKREANKKTPSHHVIPLQNSASFADSFDSYSSDIQWTFRFNDYDSYYESEGLPPDESRQSLFEDQPPAYSLTDGQSTEQPEEQTTTEAACPQKPEEGQLVRISPEPSEKSTALIWENECDNSNPITKQQSEEGADSSHPRPSCLDLQPDWNHNPSSKAASDATEQQDEESSSEEDVESGIKPLPEKILFQFNDNPPTESMVDHNSNETMVLTESVSNETVQDVEPLEAASNIEGLAPDPGRNLLSKSLSFDSSYFNGSSRSKSPLFITDDAITCPSNVENFDNTALFQCSADCKGMSATNADMSNNGSSDFNFEPLSKSATTVDFSLDTIPENKRV